MPLKWIDDELQQLAEASLLRTRVVRNGKIAATVVVDGETYRNFATNDYLGIAADPRLEAAVRQTVSREGFGSGASPLILGRSEVHAELEQQLASWLRTEAALLFPTGFAANIGTIPALVGKGDMVISDAKNHASIVDGCRLSGARVVIYPHADCERLDAILCQEPAGARKLIVTDGLFSMDGDYAPLVELVDLAERHGAMVMVDEAHALGVVGEEGRGTAEYFQVAANVDVRVGTLSKSFGCHGGFVAGSQSLITYLSNRGRSYVFSTAGPSVSAAAALAALKIMQDEPERRTRLLDLADHVRNSLAQQGWNTGDSTSHIVPVILGNATSAIAMATQLRQRGVWVPCIRPPSVAAGESRLRISLSSTHSDEMIEHLINAFQELRAYNEAAGG